MYLHKIEYSEYAGSEREWRIEPVVFTPATLIVGKNASGKSRLLNVLTALAELLRNEKRPWTTHHWQCEFRDETETSILYEVAFDSGKVTREYYRHGRKVLLDRTEKQTRLMKATSNKPAFIHPPEDQLVMNVQRDTAEYPYLEALRQWAESLYHLSFSGAPPGMLMIGNGGNSHEINFNQLATSLLQLAKSSGEDIYDRIIDAAIRDFTAVGYDLEFVKVLHQPVVESLIPVLTFKERDLKIQITQLFLSAGMFRAFAMLVIINIYIIEKRSGLLVIDDLGESLDYDRSSRLTELLFAKVKDSHFRLVATSNDRFLMNKVPVENWNVLDRHGQVVTVYNYANSKTKFDEFNEIGLNNFDLLASNFLTRLGDEASE